MTETGNPVLFGVPPTQSLKVAIHVPRRLTAALDLRSLKSPEELRFTLEKGTPTRPAVPLERTSVEESRWGKFRACSSH
jgi:hypothetical protein